MGYYFSMLRVVLKWRQCPKEVPIGFQKAMENACNYIVESERIKKAWQPILHKDDAAGIERWQHA